MTFDERGSPAAATRIEGFETNLLDAVGHPIIAVDTARTVIYWNKAAERKYGWTAEEAVGRSSLELITRHETPAGRQAMIETLLRGETWSADCEVKVRDGATMSVYVTNTPVLDAKGRLVAIIGASVDAGERRRISAIVDGSGDAIFEATTEGIITSWNPAAERLFEYSRDEIIGQHVSVMAPSDRVAEQDEARARVNAGGAAEHVETVRLRKDGSPVDVLLTASPTTDVDGAVVGVSVIIHDITERRASQRAIETSRRQLADAQRIAHLGSAEFNVATGTMNGSAEYLRILGLEPDQDLTADVLCSLVHHDDRQEWVDASMAAVQLGTTFDFGFRLIRPDGEKRWVRSRGVADVDADGAVATVFVTLLDETERVEAELARERSQQLVLEAESERFRLERANQAKSEFLSRMSHELRTPLNAILGFGQILLLDDLTVDQRENVGIIRSSGAHLLGLINDVLDISGIEAGHVTLSLEPVDLQEVVEHAITLIRLQADQRSLTVDARVGDEVFVMADRQRLLQILLNLLSNAVKYNRAGGRIDVSYESSGGKVRLAVTDTGSGMSPSNLARLFTPFDRLGAESTGVEGTGVGLALSRLLSNQMGGSLEVHSVLGTGSTFSLELPASAPPIRTDTADRAVPVGPVESDAKVVTVLVIEDNAVNVRLIERAMQRRDNVELLVGTTGGLGLDLAREYHPDLVLLDLHLPDLAGEEVLRRILADPHTAEVPIVICSADAQPNTTLNLIEQGAAAYMTKPVDIAELFDLVERVRAGLPITPHRP